jgi:16S rRNA (cytosine1402-N4)-methyltransferase
MMYHTPVLLNECIEGLNIRPDGTYVDVTFGSGGHSKRILEKLTSGKLVAFDQDPDSEQNKLNDERFQLIHQNFRFVKNFLKFQGISRIDGLLADLGISSWQIDQAERGFSTRLDGPLDMRMSQDSGISAGEIINKYNEEKLIRLFRENAEAENPKRLAAEIIKARESKPVQTTGDLKEILLKVAPRGKENQYLAKIFQGIRIEVNEEITALRELLVSAHELLNPGGRLVIISYHSLEDRIVKNFFRSGNLEGKIVKDFYGQQITPFILITRKALQPGEAELAANLRSRSAKLRIAEKI